jgi:hypothetical protein
MILLVVLIVIVLNTIVLVWHLLVGRPTKCKHRTFYDKVIEKNDLLYVIYHMIMIPIALICLVIIPASSIFLCIYKLIKGEELFPYL